MSVLFQMIWQVSFLEVFEKTLYVILESCKNIVYCTTENITDILKNNKSEIQHYFNHTKLTIKIYNN